MTLYDVMVHWVGSYQISGVLYLCPSLFCDPPHDDHASSSLTVLCSPAHTALDHTANSPHSYQLQLPLEHLTPARMIVYVHTSALMYEFVTMSCMANNR